VVGGGPERRHLRENGTTFTRTLTSNPVCSPTRATIHRALFEGARSDADVSVPQLVFRNKRANVNVVHDPAYQRARQQLMKEMMHRVMLQEFPLPPLDLVVVGAH